MDMKQKIMKVLNEIKTDVELDEGMDLIKSMEIDSHDIFNIIVGLEEAFEIEIDPTYLKVSNFSSVERIEKMICEIKNN